MTDDRHRIFAEIEEQLNDLAEEPPPNAVVEKLPESYFHEGADGLVTREMWPVGPWTTEPDRISWIDASTGYPCLIVRNRMGGLCGYVGLSDAHPWYGINYNGCLNRHAPLTRAQKQERAEQFLVTAKASGDANMIRIAELGLQPYIDGKMSRWADLEVWECTSYDANPRCSAPEESVRVHGGLTFAGEGGGAALVHAQATGLWFFGFDCGHSFDLMPGMIAIEAYMHKKTGGDLWKPDKESNYAQGYTTQFGLRVTYRTVGYVRREVEQLAKQLKEKEMEDSHGNR